MRVYLALCCLILALVAVSGNLCGGRDHDDPSPCAGLLSCNGTATLGCQEHVCTCIAGKKACSQKTECVGVCHGDKHSSPENEHCLDGFCQCAEVHH